MPDIDAIILAAGLSRRMGASKLLLQLGSSTVFDQFLCRFPYQLFCSVIVVFSDRQVADIARKYPVKLCPNDSPSTGKSDSIRLGLGATDNNRGILFAVADQPRITPATVQRLVDEFDNHPHCIILPQSVAGPANPVIFPADLRAELATLSGDEGGKKIIQRYPHRVRKISFDCAEEFQDIDTRQQYRDAFTSWKPEES